MFRFLAAFVAATEWVTFAITAFLEIDGTSIGIVKVAGIALFALALTLVAATGKLPRFLFWVLGPVSMWRDQGK